MIKPLALLVAAMAILQAPAVMAESRLSSVAANGKPVSVSARLAFTVQIAATLTLQVSDGGSGTSLADSAGDQAAIRLSSNQGSATLSCAAGTSEPRASDHTLLDSALSNPVTVNEPAGAAAGCGSLSLGSSGINHWLDTATAAPLARLAWSDAHPAAAVRVYTASQP